jgi:hypothetical protein
MNDPNTRAGAVLVIVDPAFGEKLTVRLAGVYPNETGARNGEISGILPLPRFSAPLLLSPPLGIGRSLTPSFNGFF